jgi:hypothetical protein
MSPLIAHDRDRRIERPQAIEAEPTQDLAHRRDRQAELPRDCRRAEALPAQSFNCGQPFRRRAAAADGAASSGPGARWRRPFASVEPIRVPSVG